MIRLLAALLLLSTALPVLAEDPAPATAEERLEAKRKQLQDRIAERRAARKKLEEERDAARVKANTYVLPKYKLEAQQKQEQIDGVDKEIAALEKQLEALSE